MDHQWEKTNIRQPFYGVVEILTVASEAYHDWSGEATGVQLRVNFMLKLLLIQNEIFPVCLLLFRLLPFCLL